MRPRNFAVLAGAIAVAVAAAIAQQQGQPRQQGQAGQQQQQQPQQPPGGVTGTVMSATTGEPLRKAILTLQPQGGRGGQPVSTSSDTSGAFRFLSVPPGEYQLRGERTGYVDGVYGQDLPGGEVRRISVASGQTANGIQLKLTPHSVVIGRVYDEDGDPVEGAFVQVQRYTYNRQGRTLSNAGQGQTNDIGEYRVAGLPPGRYYVSANAGGGGGRGGRGGRGGFFGDAAADPNQAEEGYATTYYPRVADVTGATAIDLVPGSELRGIDIGLMKTRLYTITGSIDGVPVGPVQLPAELEQLRSQIEQLAKGGKGKAKGGRAGVLAGAVNVQLNLTPRQNGGGGRGPGRGPAGGVRVDPQRGTFEIRGVTPGSYYLMAETRGLGNQQQQMTARVPVDVASGDVSNVVVRLMPPLQIAGKVIPEKQDSNLKFSAVRLNFATTGPAPGGGPGRITVADDGTFATTLTPNLYTVEMGGAPEGYYLKAVKFASREVPNAELDLNYTGGPVEIVIANDSGTISGRVNNSKGEPAASVRVTAVPVNSQRRDLFKSVTAGEDGSFSITTVPPGEYRVYAWEDIEGSAWMDADFRKPFENLAERADVKGSMSPNLTVRLIERSALAAAGVQ